MEIVFKKEFASFEMEEYLSFTKEVMKCFPDYFWANKGNNGIVKHVKQSFSVADDIFSIPGYKRITDVPERDCVRSAILLRNGFYYGDGTSREPNPLAGEMMAQYLKHSYWDAYLPTFLREDVINAVAVKKDAAPRNEIERAVILSESFSSKKTPAIDIKTASMIVREMIDGTSWDGNVYKEQNKYFVLLNGNRVPVASALYGAFITIGQAIKGHTEYVQ